MHDAEPVAGVSPATGPGCAAGSTAELVAQPAPSRVGITRPAAELLVRLVARHGPVIFHQSGGCCDGSAPMCYPEGDLLTGDADVLLGRLVVPQVEQPVPVFISRAQYPAWRHTHLVIDAVPGRGSGFSLEGPQGLRFLTRSRLLTDEEEALELPV